MWICTSIDRGTCRYAPTRHLRNRCVRVCRCCCHFSAIPITPQICPRCCYGVATIGRLLKIIGLFCRISSLLQGSFAQENYDFKEPTNRCHTIFPYAEIYTRILVTHTRHLIYTEWRRFIGCLIFIGHILQNSLTVGGSFAERDLQLTASYPCTT